MSATPPQPRFSSQTTFARSRMYGIQPIWPSAYMIFRFGKRSNLPLISQSTIEKQQLAKVIVEPTAGGASAEVDGIFEDEPMCMAMTVPVSSQARRKGSHSSVWMEGSPRCGGISREGRRRARPRAALRRTSAAASSRVPQRDEGERDQAAARLGAAPLLHHPVVVRPHAEQPQLAVLGLGEGLAAEAGEGREAERGLDVVDVHVGEAVGHAEGARAASARR